MNFVADTLIEGLFIASITSPNIAQLEEARRVRQDRKRNIISAISTGEPLAVQILVKLVSNGVTPDFPDSPIEQDFRQKDVPWGRVTQKNGALPKVPATNSSPASRGYAAAYKALKVSNSSPVNEYWN